MYNILKHRNNIHYFSLLFCFIVLSGCCLQRGHKDTVYQYSVINALMEGVYDGEVSVGCLKHKGDFGIGTFNGLDGELVALGGEFYQVKSDGKAYLCNDKIKVPFVVEKFFKPEQGFCLNQEMSYDNLTRHIDALLESKNVFYALEISGEFSYIKVRSVPAQNKPYVGLGEAVKNQAVFEYENVKGSLVGFRFPEYMQGVNVPGYHLHFIDKDRDFGGHLLDCVFKKGIIKLDKSSSFYMRLPDNQDFLNKDLAKRDRDGLMKAEKGR